MNDEQTPIVCGPCGHPLHWRECDTEACDHRNDIATMEPVARPRNLSDDDVRMLVRQFVADNHALLMELGG